MKVIKHQASDGSLHDTAKAAFEHDALRTIELQVAALAQDSEVQYDIVGFVKHNAGKLRELLNTALTRPRLPKNGN